MRRSIDRDEDVKKAAPRSDGDVTQSRSSNDSRPRLAVDIFGESDFGDNIRERITLRDREYSLRLSEHSAMKSIGSFRVIRDADLTKGVYSGDVALTKADMKSLNRQGLVRSITIRSARDGIARIHSLSKHGYELVMSRHEDEKQRYYWGLVKPAEIRHDSALYGAYLRERREIGQSGGKVTRVILDYELKREHYSRVNKPGVVYRDAQAASQRELNLPIVDGHVMFPDCRVEYEDERGSMSRVDIEVATENYRSQHLAAKAAAGFHIYGGGGSLRVESGSLPRGNVFPRENRTAFEL